MRKEVTAHYVKMPITKKRKKNTLKSFTFYDIGLKPI